MLLCREMPMAAVSDTLGEHDTRLWRVAAHYVEAAHAKNSWAKVRAISVDETSARRGHRYVTNVLDAQTHELLLMVEGRRAAALEAFAQALVAHGGRTEQIELISMDMSPAYQSGASQFFPRAQIVFDRFHLMQMAGQAVDRVRKELARQGADLKGSLWALRGNEWTLSQEQCQQRSALCNRYPKLGRAIGLRDTLQDILADEDQEALRWWCTFNYPQVEAKKATVRSEMSVQIETLVMQSLGWGPRKTSARESLGLRRPEFQREKTKHGLVENVQSATLRMCACRNDLGCSSNRCLEGSVRAFRLSVRIGRTRRRHIDSYPIVV